jgi:hypothetical protein
MSDTSITDNHVAAATPAEITIFERPITDHGKAIVIADRGWVWVGDVTDDGEWVHIQGARCIRRWGTGRGLGQLVGGPTAETRLDAPADLKVRLGAVIAIQPVEASKWTTD